MSGNDDNTNPARDEGPANTFETPSPTKAQDHINISSSAGNISPSFRSSSVPAPSSMTQESPQVVCSTPNADTDGQNGHHQPTPVTKVGDSKEPLEDFDWDDLEERFCRKMEECGEVEKELEGEFGEWLEVFKAWSEVTSLYEPERAHKRLRTRMAYVQGAEKSLEEKRQHYIKVVKAFESALALLGGP